MYRRQQFGMVDPRNVAPSRHTIFIRSLPGTMDIGKVKDYFSSETNEKCTVDFFALTDDRKQLSVAIRFSSHEVAREMLSKYNGKSLFGHQVEVKWFKDLKKARAKMYEEQRQGGRQFQRSNFKNNFRNGPDRRSGQSPGNQRRGRSRSSSSGGNARGQSYRDNLDRGRYSRSRSRSFTGSSSQSRSNSVKSGSQSPSRTRQPLRLNSSTRDEDYSANRGERNFDDHQTSRNRSQRSPSRSSSTSLSSGARKRSNSARNPDRKDRNSRSRPNPSGNSPINYRNQVQRSKNLSASPEINDRNLSSYSNAPAPEFNNGSSLVSGLIQLKRRGQSNQQSSNRATNTMRRQRSSGSSSGASPDLNRGRNNAASKRLRSLSPLDNTAHPSTRNVNNASSPSGKSSDQKRRKTRNANRSPSSHRRDSNDSRTGRLRTPNLDHASSASESAKPDNSSRTRRANASKSSRTSVPSEKSSTSRRTGAQHTPDPKPIEEANNFRDNKNWSSPSMANESRKRKSANSSDDYESYGSDGSDHGISKTKQINGGNQEKKSTKEVNSASSKLISEQHKDNEENMDDSIDLIRLRKESLAQDYKRDCEAFTTVVRTLISKDADLEGRLMPMLKEVLHERGQRCIEELRAYIAEHQPAAADKSLVVGQPDNLE